MRRALFAVACLGLLLAPTALAAPPSPGEVVQDTWEEKEHCFLILAQPYETPQEIVFGLASVAVCLATA